MTIKGRVIKLEQRQEGAPIFYFVASKAVAAREGIPLLKCVVTDHPEHDPAVPCTLTHEEIVAVLDEETDMHPLERRLSKLEPRSVNADKGSTVARETLLQRLSCIRTRATGATINGSSLSLAEIMAGVPCSEADQDRLRNFLGQRCVSVAAINCVTDYNAASVEKTLG